MGTEKIGVGFVGVTPGRSWAARTHIPALRTLPAYRVVAVANSSLASSQAAAEALAIPRAYSSAAELVAADDVDMVAITVKVPHHKQLVDAALDAGKMVFCEWPLGNGLAEGEAMAARAAERGLRTAVGLQARNSPTIRYLRDLIRDGYIGEVLSTTLVGSAGVPGAAQMPEAYAYLSQRSNGATMMTIPFGHTIDALCWCLGDFRSVWATQALRRTSFTVAETGETRSTDAEDQLVIGGVLANGVVVSAHYRGGLCRGTTLLWEINGTEGACKLPRRWATCRCLH